MIGCKKLQKEYLRLLIIEAIQRSAKVCELEKETEINKSHFEKVLFQLMLDFS